MKTILKSTTALVLIASLAAPIPALSQEVNFDTTGMTQEQIDAEILRLKLLEEEGEAETDGEASVEGDGAEGTGTEANESTDAGAETEAEAEVEAEVEAETSADAETATETEAEAPAESEADAEDAGPEAAPESAETNDTAAPEAEVTTETEAETEAEAPTEQAEDGEADVETEATSDAEPEAETVETTGENAEPESEVESEAAVETVDPEPMNSEAQAEAQAQAEEEVQESLAASGGGDAEAEVVEETVTEDTSRSSSEEFETDLDGATRESAEKDDDDDDDNLDTFKKAALLGLGAIALNEILRPDEEVVTNTGDRVVVQRDGQYRLLKNDDSLLRQPGSDVTTYRYEDGSTRTVVVREDGSQVETVRARDGRVLRRTRILDDGREVVLFDDTRQTDSVDVSTLPRSEERRQVNIREVNADDLAAALSSAQAQDVTRRFSLSQVRNIDAVRELVPEINVDLINFETNSAVIRPDEAQELAALGRALGRMIDQNPGEVFLIEGHTDATGAANYNLALSDRRAESVALALTEYFDLPPENLVVQGYGETDLLIRTDTSERANRRVAVRRITTLLANR